MHQRIAVLLVVAVAMGTTTMWLTAQQPQRGATNQIAIDADDIALMQCLLRRKADRAHPDRPLARRR